MEYYIYENHPNQKDKIHEAKCRHCNDGKGIKNEKAEGYAFWHGPFSSYEVAHEKATDLCKPPNVRKLILSNCEICHPEN